MFSILNKPQGTVNAEDLETLQNEIEKRLADVVTHRRKLEQELDNFNLSADSAPQLVDAIDVNSSDSTTTTVYLSNNGNSANSINTKHETDSVSSESSATSNVTGSTIILTNLADTISNTNKRSLKNAPGDRPPKRFRSNGTTIQQQRIKTEETRPPRKQLVANEAPAKLWLFVEQFCATPDEEQIRDLESMIKAIESHGSSATGSSNTNNISKQQEKSTKKGKGKANSLGALTQRIVSSFIEEDDSKLSATTDDSAQSSSRKKCVADVGNAKNLEHKIRQQLEEYQILTQQDDIPYTNDEDELSRQLRTYQHELLCLQTQNKHYMQTLLKRAKKHIELEKKREKLREASADVVSVYQRLIQAKQRRKSPTKREKDAAWKALKLHDAIFKQCDELYMYNKSL